MSATVHTPPGSNPYWRMTLRAVFVALWRWIVEQVKEWRTKA
jgi:hypothetical protein